MGSLKLKDFPRLRPTDASYLRGKHRYREILQERVLQPCRCHDCLTCCWATLLWISIFLTVSTLILTMLKDTNKVKEMSIVLEVSIAEVACAFTAIFLSFSKHIVKWCKIKQSQSLLIQESSSAEESNLERDSKKRKPDSRTNVPAIVLFTLWAMLSIFVIAAFAFFHVLDKESHQYLTYMKFTSAIALFLVAIIDIFIIDMLWALEERVKVDQCNLVINELLTILQHEVTSRQRNDITSNIKAYLKEHSLFQLNDVFHSRDKTSEEEVVLTARTLEESQAWPSPPSMEAPRPKSPEAPLDTHELSVINGAQSPLATEKWPPEVIKRPIPKSQAEGTTKEGVSLKKGSKLGEDYVILEMNQSDELSEREDLVTEKDELISSQN